MPNVIQHKRNSTAGTVPGTGALSQGEIGINISDGKFYTKNSSNNIINLGVTSISGTTITPASGLFSGSVGIGTSSPSGKFHVVGNASISGFLLASSGNFTTLQQNGTLVSVSGHTHSSSDITNFNSGVSGLLPVTNITAGTNITVSNNSGNFTINSTAAGGAGGGATISNSGVDRLLTSDGTTSGIVGQANLTFNGSLLNVTGSGAFSSNLILSNQTANTIASFDGNKNLTSLSTATYPSLTELSYVKGVTSSIQTQLGNKANTNQTMFIGTTSVTINRSSAALSLAGVSIDGNAGTVTNGVYTTGNQTIGGVKTFNDQVNIDNLRLDGNTLSSTSGNIIINPIGGAALQRDSDGNPRGFYAVDWQTVRSDNTMVAGGDYSVIGGGRGNISSGNNSTVVGGSYNTSSGSSSTVGGGNRNLAFSTGSFVGAGQNNVAAGKARRANSITSSTNTITVLNATAADFDNTTANALQIRYRVGFSEAWINTTRTVSTATQSGNNVTLVVTSNVGSSSPNQWTNVIVVNTAETDINTSQVVCGGTNNISSDSYSTVGGGYKNTSSSINSTVGGGNNNTSSGEDSTVGGGAGNTSSDTGSTVGGGRYNTSSNISSTVGGGFANTSSSQYSTVGGGYFNLSSNIGSTIGGGKDNSSSGSYSTIPGGLNANTTKHGELSHAAGYFEQNGDAQHTILIARRLTEDATANQVLFLDNISQRLTVPGRTSWVFTIKLSAYSDIDDVGGWWIFRGGIRRNSANGTVLVGSVITESGIESGLDGASANVVANNTNESLDIRVTGISGKNIRWVAVVDISQVSWPT